jgi:hypothetical protein
MRRPLRFNSEINVQEQVCDYLRLRYPFAIFRSDYASGLKLTMSQAVKHKHLQSSRAWPDLMIYEPVGGKQGLALELKRDDVKVYKLDGSLRKDEHVEEQAAMLEKLSRRGYRAEFACGFDQAQTVIDDYFRSNI